MKYSFNMRLGLVACVLLAVVGMAAAGEITDPFTSADITVKNPISFKAGTPTAITDGFTPTVASGVLTIVGPDETTPGVITVDIATFEAITAATDTKITLDALVAQAATFTITTAGTASVTGGLGGPKVVLDVSGGTVDLTGDIVDLDLTIKPKVRKNQAGAPADSTVKVDKVTGTATVTNPETATDISITLAAGATMTGTTASTVCTPGGTGTCNLTGAGGFAGPFCDACAAAVSPPGPESPDSPSSPSSPGTPSPPPTPSPSTPSSPAGPPGPSPGVSPDVAPLGCKHYRFWVQHTHGVDCEKEKNTKSEYIKWLCHNLYCN